MVQPGIEVYRIFSGLLNIRAGVANQWFSSFLITRNSVRWFLRFAGYQTASSDGATFVSVLEKPIAGNSIDEMTLLRVGDSRLPLDRPRKSIFDEYRQLLGIPSFCMVNAAYSTTLNCTTAKLDRWKLRDITVYSQGRRKEVSFSMDTNSAANVPPLLVAFSNWPNPCATQISEASLVLNIQYGASNVVRQKVFSNYLGLVYFLPSVF